MTFSEIEKSFNNTTFSKEQKAFIIAKTWHEFLQKQDEEIQKKIISENNFFYCEDCERAGIRKGDRINSIADICTLSLDKKQWNKYYNLYFTECKKRGIARAYNEVITSQSRKMVLAAGDILIDWFLEQAKKYAPDTEKFSCMDSANVKRHIIYRKKILDLAMQWKAM